MSTLATWSHVVQSRDVSPHNFDGLAMSGLAFSAAPTFCRVGVSGKSGFKGRGSVRITSGVTTRILTQQTPQCGGPRFYREPKIMVLFIRTAKKTKYDVTRCGFWGDKML